MSPISKRWIARLANGVLAAMTALLVVLAVEKLRGASAPYFDRAMFAGCIAGVIGVLGRMFVDEASRQ
jgi:hypothetical protein